MSKQLKIKHAIAFSLIAILTTSLIVVIYFVQTENQDLKTQQDSTIKVTEQKTTECLCPTCATEGTTEETTQYSTLSSLFTMYTVDYPLGWHATDSGLGYFDKDEIDTVYVHFNDGPITQIPRGGQLGKIDLIDHSGQIANFETFLTEKKDLFRNLTEETFATDSGITVYKLTGQTNQFEQWIDDVIYCLEYTDFAGDRHLVYTSLQTNFEDSEIAAQDMTILENMIKSFKIKEEQ